MQERPLLHTIFSLAFAREDEEEASPSAAGPSISPSEASARSIDSTTGLPRTQHPVSPPLYSPEEARDDSRHHADSSQDRSRSRSPPIDAGLLVPDAAARQAAQRKERESRSRSPAEDDLPGPRRATGGLITQRKRGSYGGGKSRPPSSLHEPTLSPIAGTPQNSQGVDPHVAFSNDLSSTAASFERRRPNALMTRSGSFSSPDGAGREWDIGVEDRSMGSQASTQYGESSTEEWRGSYVSDNSADLGANFLGGWEDAATTPTRTSGGIT